MIVQVAATKECRCHRLRVTGFDDEVEKPPPFAQYQLRLLRLAGFEDAVLIYAKTHCDLDTAIKRVERDSIVFEGVGAFVEVHAGAVEADFRKRLIFPDAPEFLLRLVGLAHREDGVAVHLAAQRRGLPQVILRSLVQPNQVPQTMLTHDEKPDGYTHPRRLFATQFLRHRSNQYVAPILRAPDHVVRYLIDAITFRDTIDHGSKFTPHGVLCAPTIPPAIEIASFLAEVL